MKKMIQWVLVATLTCGASVFTACSSNDPEHESSEPYRELYCADGSTYTITAHLKKVE